MLTQTQGIIIINENRQNFQTANFRSLSTLPFPANKAILDEKFDFLIKFSDITLAPQKTCTILSDNSYCVVLIPLVGALEIDEKIVDSGEIAYLFLKNKDEIIIQNPYESELINFLEIWFKVAETAVSGTFFDKFQLDSAINSVILLQNKHLPYQIYIGKYFGKVENEIELKNWNNRSFAYNINGSIEVQERLLQPRDALIVWDCEKLSYETLANETIILFITG